MVKSILVCVAVVAIFAIGITAEIVNVTPCTRSNNERNPLSTVHSVNISPCPAAPDGPCDVQLGQNVSISMDFTPNITTPGRTRHSFAWRQSRMDLQLKGMNPRACRSFDCRKPAFQRRSYSTVIPLKTTMPTGTYPVKVKIYDRSKVISCYVVTIRLLPAASST